MYVEVDFPPCLTTSPIFPVLIATSVPHKLQILNYAMIEKKVTYPMSSPLKLWPFFEVSLEEHVREVLSKVRK